MHTYRDFLTTTLTAAAKIAVANSLATFLTRSRREIAIKS